MHVSKFNYVSDHERDQQKLLINFLTQSADIVGSESADYFTGCIENNRHPDKDREYMQKRGYVFSIKDQESQIMRSLYEYELKNSVPIYAVHLDTFSKKRSKLDEILKSINEMVRKSNKELKSELVLYSKNSLDQFLSVQDLEDFVKDCNSLNMDTKIVTTQETLSFFKPLFTKELVADITLICPLSKFCDPTFFARNTEELLDQLIEHEKKVTLDLKLNLGDVKNLKPLVNYFIYKGWPILDNFKCRLVSEEDESCFFGYCYSTDTKLTREIFQVFRTYRQTEFCSMEKWIGINNVYALIWQGRPPRPSFHFCDASRGLMIFTGDGNIFPCLKLAETSRETSIKIKAGFEDFQQRNGMMLTDCQECRYTVSCGGGCSYRALIQNNGRVCCPPIKDLIEVSLETYFDEFLEKTDFLEECQREGKL